MRFAKPTILAACALLSACGKQGTGDGVSMTNASVSDVARTQVAKLQPGEWRIRVEQVSSATTGGPSNLPAPPKAPPGDFKICLTPEQVDRPEGMFSPGMAQMKNSCTYDRFSMAGGKIDAKMHCAMPGGMKVEGTNSGTFTATTITSDSNTKVTGLPGGMTNTSHIRMEGTRLGDCKPGDLKAGAAG